MLYLSWEEHNIKSSRKSYRTTIKDMQTSLVFSKVSFHDFIIVFPALDKIGIHRKLLKMNLLLTELMLISNLYIKKKALHDPQTLDKMFFKQMNVVIPCKSQTLHFTLNTSCKPVKPVGDNVIGNICCSKIRIAYFIDRSMKSALYKKILQKNIHLSIHQLKYKWIVQQ